MAEIYRTIEYDSDGEPMLVLRKKTSPILTFRLRENVRAPLTYNIRMEHAYQYAEGSYDEHDPARHRHDTLGIDVFSLDDWGQPVLKRRQLTFPEFMGLKAMEICTALGLGKANSARMTRIATCIQEGLDDLVAAPPQKEVLMTVGEVAITTSSRRGDGSVTHTRDMVVSVPEEGMR